MLRPIAHQFPAVALDVPRRCQLWTHIADEHHCTLAIRRRRAGGRNEARISLRRLHPSASIPAAVRFPAHCADRRRRAVGESRRRGCRIRSSSHSVNWSNCGNELADPSTESRMIAVEPINSRLKIRLRIGEFVQVAAFFFDRHHAFQMAAKRLHRELQAGELARHADHRRVPVERHPERLLHVLQDLMFDPTGRCDGGVVKSCHI